MTANLRAARAIQEYLARRYGPAGSNATWYFPAQGVGIRGDTAIIRSDLGTSPSERQQAREICEAVAGFIDDSEHRALGVTKIQVYGYGYVLLIDRTSPGQPC